MHTADKLEIGFHLDDGAVVLCRSKHDGWWEAWIQESGTPTDFHAESPFPTFLAPSRFKAQCDAIRWYTENVARLQLCA